jgi:ParB family transcriptional regulator, chromosome partitioning protein
VTVQQIRLDEIQAGDNDRKVFDADALAGLAASIEAYGGLIEPILVRPLLFGYEIIAGERRFRAHQLLGWDTIEAIVRDDDDGKAAIAMLVENVQRENLNPIEEADAYQARLDAGVTEAELATLTGIGVRRIRARLALRALCDEARHLVATGNLGAWYAGKLATVDHNRQIIALRQLQRTPNLGRHEWEALIADLANEQNQDALFDGDVLQVETWTPKVRKARRATRAELLALVEELALHAWQAGVETAVTDRAIEVVDAEAA